MLYDNAPIGARVFTGLLNDVQLFMDASGVTAQGNFEGKNILHRVRDNDVLAARRGRGQWRRLCGLEFELASPKEIAIVGPSTALLSAQDDAQNLLDVVFGEYRPNQVVAWKRAGAESVIPLLEEREVIEGKATVYVCQNFACQLPVTEVESLRAQWSA